MKIAGFGEYGMVTESREMVSDTDECNFKGGYVGSALARTGLEPATSGL